MRQSFLYRLYPSKTQAKRLDSVLETCRRFYNDYLAERKTAYEERGETVGKVAQLRHMTLIDRLCELAARISQQTKLIQTKEATKNAFVMPFISAPSYNIFDRKVGRCLRVQYIGV